MTNKYKEVDFIEYARHLGVIPKTKCTFCKKKKHTMNMFFLFQTEMHEENNDMSHIIMKNFKSSGMYNAFCNESCSNLWLLQNV